MTASDVSRATGISLSTVYRHLEYGKLDGIFNGRRWYIAPDECYSWAYYLWKQGRHVQYEPEYTRRFIRHFRLK